MAQSTAASGPVPACWALLGFFDDMTRVITMAATRERLIILLPPVADVARTTSIFAGCTCGGKSWATSGARRCCALVAAASCALSRYDIGTAARQV